MMTMNIVIDRRAVSVELAAGASAAVMLLAAVKDVSAAAAVVSSLSSEIESPNSKSPARNVQSATIKLGKRTLVGGCGR